MSKSNNGDWTLCWWFNSETGCKNPNCTWRHEKFTDVHYQTQQQKIGNFHSRDPSEKLHTPTHPVNQQCKRRINDQYCSQYPSVCKDNRTNHNYEFWSKLLQHELQSEYCRPVSNSMSESSSVKMQDLISSSNSVITSLGGSDSDCDIFKNYVNVSTGEQTMIQKKLCTPRNAGIKSKSALSPYAKVFVPSVDKLALGESSSFSGEVVNRLPNCNSPRIILGKVYE